MNCLGIVVGFLAAVTLLIAVLAGGPRELRRRPTPEPAYTRRTKGRQEKFSESWIAGGSVRGLPREVFKPHFVVYVQTMQVLTARPPAVSRPHRGQRRKAGGHRRQPERAGHNKLGTT